MSTYARLCACVMFLSMTVWVCIYVKRCVYVVYKWGLSFVFVCTYVCFYVCEKWVCEMCLVLSYNVLITGSIGVLESFGEKNMSISRPWKVFIFQNQETVSVSFGIFKFVQNEKKCFNKENNLRIWNPTDPDLFMYSLVT